VVKLIISVCGSELKSVILFFITMLFILKWVFLNFHFYIYLKV